MDRRTFLKVVPVTVLAAAAPRLVAQTAATASSAPAAGAGAGSSAGAAATADLAGNLQVITLLKPQKDSGKSVLAALQVRRTIRNISEQPLPPQMLSNLLWAAFGVNWEGQSSGRIARTAASASNSQEIDLYVALPEGVYLYEAALHRLVPVVAGDLRAKVGCGRGGSGAKAPVRLIYVVDIAKYSRGTPQEPGLRDPEIQKAYYHVATGLIAGNVYLFAASQGLAAWFHNCDKPGLTKDLNLRPDQRVLFAQTVGYPA